MQILKASFVFLFLIGGIVACPEGCICDGDICDSCGLGYFDAAFSAEDPPVCQPCPLGCTDCILGQNGKPACSECDKDWQFDESQNSCFKCELQCASCQFSPDNCPTCNPPYVSVTDLEEVPRCLRDPYCPRGCAVCSLSSQLILKDLAGDEVTDEEILANICESCLPGYFNAAGLCYECTAGCSECSFDEQRFWLETVVPFWEQIFTEAGNLTNETQFDDLDLDNITEIEESFWSLGYFLFEFILDQTNQTGNVSFTLIAQALQKFVALADLTEADDRWDSFADFINDITNRDFEDEDIQDYIVSHYQSFSECTVCQDGFKLSDNDTKLCEQCEQGCTTCNQLGCTGCQDGFYLNLGTCTECDPTCKTCDGAGSSSCTACQLPLSLAGSTCIQCDSPCRTCDIGDTSSCLTCKLPYSIDANAGSCYTCDDRRCTKCSFGNTSICQQCLEGHVVVEGQCVSCPNNCISCGPDEDDIVPDDNEDNNTFIQNVPAVYQKCFQCALGYFIDEDGECESCPRGCTKCNENQECSECFSGNYLHPDQKECKSCETGCLECDFEGCLVFEEGFVVTNGQIRRCDPGCSQCDPSGLNTCLSCQDGFWLDTNVCKRCTPGCEKCQDGSSCDECKIGFFESDNETASCQVCPWGCQKCSNSDVCDSCLRGYNLENGQCVKNCDEECIECDAGNFSICLKCKPGYALDGDDTCVKCASSCSGSCDISDRTLCTECGDGFRREEDKCVRCEPGELTCLEQNALLCMPGYELVQHEDHDICRKICLRPCEHCDEDGNCEECPDGYELEDGVCVIDEDELCSADCQFCLLGSELLESGSCRICATEDCLVCDEGICEICRPGKYLGQDANCVDCPAQCRTCYDGETCELCADGYFKEIVSMDQGLADAVFSNTCSACDQNCKTCSIEADRCQSCYDGYRLTKASSTCVGRFSVGIHITYETDFDQFDLEEQLRSFVSHLGISLPRILLNELRRGSTIMDVSISADSDEDAQQLQAAAEDTEALTGGAPVQSSSVAVFYDDDQVEADDEDDDDGKIHKASVGLIVGVVIGGVALLAIISFVIYRVCLRKKHHEDRTPNYVIEGTENKFDDHNYNYSHEKVYS